MKHIIWAFLLLSASAFAQQQTIYCNSGNQIPCNATSNAGSGVVGDPAWKAFGKVNANETQLYNTDSSQSVEAGTSLYCGTVVNTSSDATPCLQAAANAASLTSNRTLHIPGGTYQIKTRWNCPANGINLIGDRWNLTTGSIGTELHIVSSQFMVGGPQAGNHPFQCGSGATVAMFSARGLKFTEDQPVDAPGWTPNNYGAMWLFANGSYIPKFEDDYFAGVNYPIEFLSIQGAYVQNNYFQVFTTGVQIDHNGDWLHASHNHFNDFWCTVANCPNITAYTQANAVGFQSNRNDNPSFVDNEAFGLFAGIQLGTDGTGVTTNAKVTQFDCDKCLHTVNITAAGTSAQLDQLQGHTFNFAGNAALRGGTIVSESGGTAVLQISNLRCQNAGDACLSFTGSGDTVVLTNSYLFSWGQNSAANGTCDATVSAINAGAANANSVRINNVSFSAGGCSTLTYSSSNTVSASNGQYGSWTPTLNFGGTPCTCTYTAHTGQYQVDDHRITVQFQIAVSALSGSGAATITGLPFTTSSSGNWGGAGWGSCANYSNFASLTGSLILETVNSSTTLNVFQNGASGVATVTNSNFTNTSNMRCQFTYFQ